VAKLQVDLKEFIELLSSHSVEYVIVGGQAVAFFVRTTPANAQRLLAVLTDFGFSTLGITERDLLESRRIVQLGHPPNRIEILTSISGVDFDSAWETRVESTMDGQPVSIIGWNELLRNKKAAGQKDLADIDKLLGSEAQRWRRLTGTSTSAP
jgi:hypothetical protein